MTMDPGRFSTPLALEAPPVVSTSPWIPKGRWWAEMVGAVGPQVDGMISQGTYAFRGYRRSDLTSRWRARLGTRLFQFTSVIPDHELATITVQALETGTTSVTFTRVTQVEDEGTGAVTPTVTTVTGKALQVSGDPERYKALGLVLTTMPSLSFTPSPTGQLPQPGDTVTWGGTLYAVRDVEAVAPDGVTLAARVVIGR